MLMIKWVMLLILSAPITTLAATYYADPSGGAAASCVDSGANVCTLVRAEAVATNGDTIVAACGTYDLAASTLTINVNVDIAPLTAGCAIITGTNATSIVTLTAANHASPLTFGAFEVQNTGGGTSSTMLVSNVAYDAVVILSGTIISVGGTNRHLADQWTRGTLLLDGVTLSGTVGAQAGIYSVVTPSSAKKLSVTDCILTLTLSTVDTYAIRIERAAGTAVSEWVYVANNTVSVTAPMALGASGTATGIRLNRITTGTDISGNSTPPIVEGNTVTVTAIAATAASNYGILTGSTDATAVADNVVIRNNTVTCNTPTDRCISIGTDAVTANFAANNIISGNTITSLFYDGSNTPHAVSLGRVTGGTVISNRINGSAVGILISINQGGVVAGNVVYGSQYAPLFSKGSGGTTAPIITNNTVIMDDTIYGAKFGGYGCMGVASQSGTNNTAATFTNNLCYVRSGTGWKHVIVDSSQAASFDGNDYVSDVTLTSPWSYQGTTYATLTLWNAAATVGTELDLSPSLMSATDFRTQGNSLIRRAGIPTAYCYEFRGRPCWQTPDIGAYQATAGDRANTRTAR